MINKILEKIEGKWIFLLSVLSFYLGLALFRFDLLISTFNVLSDLVVSLIPIFILIFILMFISNLFFDAKKVSKYVGKDAGLKGWLITIIAGIMSSGPIYMWFPILSEMKEKGMSDRYIATFLYNRSVKIPLIPIMIYYFGLPFTIIFNIYIIIFSVVNGLLVSIFLNLNNNENSHCNR